MITLPAGFASRTPTEMDAEAVCGALAASRAADGDVAPDIDDVLSDWAEVNLEEEAVVVCDAAGTVVAGADVLGRDFTRVTVYGYVHPKWRGLGIGRALVAWGEAWTRDHMHEAPAGSRVVVDHFILSAVEPARRLLSDSGYLPIRTTFIMRRDLTAPPDADIRPDVRIRTFMLGEDDAAVFDAVEAAFADVWGRPPGTLESLTAPTHAPNFDPTLWFLAEEVAPKQLLGVCLAQLSVGNGWIRTLGVRPEARRRGIGHSLLMTAFGALRDRGARWVELSVDAESPTNAPRVYQRAGMQVDRRILLFQKEIRAGGGSVLTG